ncbi:MAG: SusC/RagA family TonB-linked outer membrane protein, partial [Bacteroidia bacterium]
MNDINPADIADIQVLKGAAAAAVWGTRAANGVILITTKKGRKGMSVDFTTSMSFDQVNREYEKQSIYGQGVNGTWRANNALSWGDVIDNRSGTDDVNDQGAYFLGDQTGTKYYPILAKGDKTVYNDANRAQVFRTG